MSIELKPREPAGNHSITIEDSYWQFAKQLGNGNASAGIRKALYEAYDRRQAVNTQELLSNGA